MEMKAGVTESTDIRRGMGSQDGALVRQARDLQLATHGVTEQCVSQHQVPPLLIVPMAWKPSALFCVCVCGREIWVVAITEARSAWKVLG